MAVRSFARLGTIFSIMFGCFLVDGCASVKIVRVKDDDYATEGLRFYRPRPYLVVNQPFPIGGGDFFAYGTVDATKLVISIEPSQLPPAVRDLFGMGISGKVELAPNAFDIPAVGTPTNAQQKDNSGSGNAGTNSGSTTADNKPTTQPAKESTTATTQKSQPTTTKSEFTTSLDPGTEPLEKVNDLFSVLYMQDFDQQYAIQVDGGLGQSSADIKLRYGWMMENAAWSVDNKQIGEFIFSNVTKLIDLGVMAAQTAIAPGSAQAIALATQKEQNLTAMDGKTALLRIRYVIEAEPGVYPILKPGEFSAIPPAKVAGVNRTEVMLPMPPYTLVSYNFRRTVAIEVVNGNATQLPNSSAAGKKLSADQYKLVKTWINTNIQAGLAFSDLTPELLADGTLNVFLQGPALNLSALNDKIPGKFKDNPLPIPDTKISRIILKAQPES